MDFTFIRETMSLKLLKLQLVSQQQHFQIHLEVNNHNRLKEFKKYFQILGVPRTPDTPTVYVCTKENIHFQYVERNHLFYWLQFKLSRTRARSSLVVGESHYAPFCRIYRKTRFWHPECNSKVSFDVVVKAVNDMVVDNKLVFTRFVSRIISRSRIEMTKLPTQESNHGRNYDCTSKNK